MGTMRLCQFLPERALGRAHARLGAAGKGPLPARLLACLAQKFSPQFPAVGAIARDPADRVGIQAGRFAVKRRGVTEILRRHPLHAARHWQLAY